MRTPHTKFRRGKRILVVLRDGTKLVGKFHERVSKWLVLDVEDGELQKIPFADIRVTSFIPRDWRPREPGDGQSNKE